MNPSSIKLVLYWTRSPPRSLVTVTCRDITYSDLNGTEKSQLCDSGHALSASLELSFPTHTMEGKGSSL